MQKKNECNEKTVCFKVMHSIVYKLSYIFNILVEKCIQPRRIIIEQQFLGV